MDKQNEVTLYHGTNESSAYNICQTGVNFSKSRKGLDFGPGFYVTDDYDVARRRAISQTKKFNRINRKKEKPAIVKIVMDETYLNSLSVKKFEYCNKEWLNFILANRLSRTYLKEHLVLDHNQDLRYDIVIGSIADSDISLIVSHIEDGDLTLEDISVYDVLTSRGKTIGLQLSFHTEKSLISIKSKSIKLLERRDK